MIPDFLAPLVFRGKRALVTGGSRGIGAAISHMLSACGAHVFINYREDDRSAQNTLQSIEANQGSATPIRANLLNSPEIRRLFGEISDSGGLDFLVHCAALGSFKPTLEVRPNQWDLSMNVNARGLLMCARQAVPLMEAAGGKIVSVSSLGSRRYLPNYGAIGISKAALETLTRYLAVELAPRKIHVNAVSAGLVETDSVRRHPHYQQMVSRTREQTPMGRLATPEDVARVVLFLCSPLSDWICGQTVVADGGLSLQL